MEKYRLLPLIVVLQLFQQPGLADSVPSYNECSCLIALRSGAPSELVCLNMGPGAAYPLKPFGSKQIDGPNFVCRGYELSAPSFGIEAIDGELGRGLSNGQRILKVDLSSNQLTKLNQPHFASLPNLRRLELANNRIELVTYQLFDNLHQLIYLDLDRNSLTEVTQQTFGTRRVLTPGNRCNLKSLLYLYLANNRIERVDPSSFECMSNLQVLNLQKNSIATLPNDAFAGLSAISSVKLYGNRLHSVADAAFDQCCTQLRYLSMVDNRLSHLSRTIFNSMGNLTSLYLDRNQFVQVPTYLLAHANGMGPASLTDVHMQRNHIVQVRANDFKGAGKIDSLNLYDNSIQRIEDYSFVGLSWTKNLVLQKNELRSVTNRTLAGLTNLRYLVLTDNHIEYIEDYAFAPLPRLDTLSLAANRLTEIRRLMFSALNHTFSLNLAANYIQSLLGDEFELLPSLRYLYLEKNQLTRLRENYFRGLSGLRKLDLSDNRIRTIDSLAFRDLEQLAFLDLSGNALTAVCFSGFYGLTGLHSLFLGKNQIEALDPDMVARLRTLGMLDMRDNRLTDFAGGWAVDESLPTSALTYLDLDGNNLRPNDCTFCGLDAVRYASIGVQPRNSTHVTVSSLRGLGRWSDLELKINGHRLPAAGLELGASSWQPAAAGAGACSPDDVTACRLRHADSLRDMKARACRLNGGRDGSSNGGNGGSVGRSGSDGGKFARLMLYVTLPVLLLLLLVIGSVSAFYLVARRRNAARAAAATSAHGGVGFHNNGDGGAGRAQLGVQEQQMQLQQQQQRMLMYQVPPQPQSQLLTQQQQQQHQPSHHGRGLTAAAYDTEASLLELSMELSPSNSDVKFNNKLYGNLLT